METYLGDNLNRALKYIGRKQELALDLRTDKYRENPAAVLKAPKALYKITRTEGCAPRDVSYWGRKVCD